MFYRQMFLYYLVLHSFSIITTYLKGIEFCEHVISQTEKKKKIVGISFRDLVIAKHFTST